LDLCTCSTNTYNDNNNDDWLLLFTAPALHSMPFDSCN